MNPRIFPAVLLIVAVIAEMTQGQVPVEFAPPTALFTNFPIAPSRMWAHDVLGTPAPDVIWADNLSIHVFDTQASSSNTASLASATPAFPVAADFGDLDADSDDDIVVGSGAAGQSWMTVLKKTGQALVRTDIPATSGTSRVHLVDHNGDGALDITCGGQYWLNNGSGVFGAPTTIAVGSATPWDVLPGDVDGDGDIDFVSTFFESVSGGLNYSVAVATQGPTAAYTLSPTQVVRTGANYASARVTDVTGDGMADFVYHVISSSVVRHQNLKKWVGAATGTATGGLTLRPSVELYAAGLTFGIDVADFSGTGQQNFTVPMGVNIESPTSGPAALQVIGLFGVNAAGDVVGVPGRGVTMPWLTPSVATPMAIVNDYDLDGRPDLIVANTFLVTGPSSSSFGVALNLTGTPVIPSIRESIGVDLCAQRMPSGAFGVTLRAGPGGPAIQGKLVTATMVFPNGQTQVSHQFSTGVTELDVSPQAFTGPAQCTISVAEGVVFSGTLYSAPAQLAMSPTFGGGQATALGQPFTNPIGGHLTNVLGQPLPGVLVDLAPSTAVLEDPSGDHYTNATGDVTIPVRAGTVAGPITADLTAGGMTLATIPLVACRTTLSIAAGDAQVDYSGGTFLQPLDVLVQGCQAPPTGTVTFTPSSPAATCQPAVATIDAAGHATTTVTLSANASGPIQIDAAVGQATASFSLFARSLSLTSAATTFVLAYRHEHAGMPLALAADAAVGIVPTTTPWGTVITSILTPGPQLIVIDGLGLLGPVDGSMVTGAAGLWQRVLNYPPPSGVTLRLQMYGYDYQSYNPREYVVSNPVTLNL